MYVVDIKFEENKVVLGEEGKIFLDGLIVYDLNFILFDKLEFELEVIVKIWYIVKEVKVRIIFV